MNKKGFTLIEVIGVVTILSIILIVAVPSLTRTLKRNEQNKYNDYINNLKIASENYLVDLLKSGEVTNNATYITLGDLIDAGYIKNTVTNPENDKTLSRDTRIKAYKDVDGTYSYDIHECYNTTDDYDNQNLIVHYDAVEYSPNNVFENLTNESDFDYSLGGNWTEDGVLFSKGENSMPKIELNNSYSTEQITVSFNIESLDDVLSGSYHYLFSFERSAGKNLGFQKSVSLFYGFGTSAKAVFAHNGNPIEKNKKYTLTYVQEDLTTRKFYINGQLMESKSDLVLANIDYNGFVINGNAATSIYDLNVHNLLIYNRALSADEVKELYELDKERFGE